MRCAKTETYFPKLVTDDCASQHASSIEMLKINLPPTNGGYHDVFRIEPVVANLRLSKGAMTTLEHAIRNSSNFDGYPANHHGLPSLDSFVAFVAQRLVDDSVEPPTSATISVNSQPNHRFNINGTAMIRDQAFPIEGHVVWLPKTKCFRGHVFVDPDKRVRSILKEDADAVRKISWHQSAWNGNDFDQCRLCMTAISEQGTDAIWNSGYTAENQGWLCPGCYENVVVNGYEHPWL